MMYLVNRLEGSSMIDILFDRMDSWRHLPSYQLERRADIFFSLYLQPVLQAKLDFGISPIIIPEFPVRIGTIYPNIKTDKSYKIDYVCFSADTKTAILVELKTEGQSRRESQDKYLVAAREVGFTALLDGILKIFKATNSKRKYFYLLDMLAQAGFLSIPAEMYETINKDCLQGINSIAGSVKVLDCPQDAKIVYIQPNGDGPDIISFEEFRGFIEASDDLLSKRFAQSLHEWATVKAGHKK